ncbi:alpha/beta hydrolase [Mycolicibacterium septicum]|uniref:alpha/beta hydrolase n=1 Tax=Mycolicibacterium septicum TaxID=98668 RepID=UPI002361C1FF|nr:alpha/beta hydrolase [Mycolicibacterium septicum]
MTDRLDVVYSTQSGQELQLDIYPPTGPSNYRTAVLLVHGGGFRHGDRKLLAPRCAVLAQHGFTAIAVQYRLIDDTNTAWPDPLDDVQDAISWTAAHAQELGVEADRIVVQGHSAGAQMALMAAAASPDSVAAVIAYYPLVEFVVRDMPELPTDAPPTPEMMAAMIQAARGEDGTTPASMLLGPAANEAQAAQASPINQVSAGLPPTLILQGTADMVVAPAASFRLFQALQAAGVTAELHILADCLHEFDATPSLTTPSVAVVESFLHRFVIDAKGFAEEEAAHNPLALLGRPPT